MEDFCKFDRYMLECYNQQYNIFCPCIVLFVLYRCKGLTYKGVSYGGYKDY